MAQNNKAQKPITLSRAFGFVVPICVCAVFLAAAVISVANDMYAFVKPDETIEVSVDSALDTSEFAKLLGSKGIVKNPFIFELYLRTKGRDAEIPYLRGEWTLNRNMSYRDIILEIF